MTAQELKNSILQLAVQGKLVPQSAEDEPAVELVKRIITEKQRHISSGAIKKEKALPPITEDELPFDIPETWAWVRLSDISNITAGGTPSRTITSYWNGDIPWVKISDISDKYVNSTEECITQRGLDNSSAKVFSKGTLLYTIFATIGTVGILNIDAATNQAIAGVTFYGEYDLDYMYYVAVGLKDLLVAKGKGMAQMNINQTILKSTPIPIPPLAEQRRIVAKIEELLPLVAEYDEAEQKLSALNDRFPDKLRQSILQQAIQGKLTERAPDDEPASELLKRIQMEKAKLIAEGKIKKEKQLPPITEDDCPFEIPNEWEWVRLTDVGEVSRGRSKHRPRNDTILYRDGKYPLIQTGDVARSGGLITSCSASYNDVGLAQSRMWPNGTLCLTIAANIADVGILDFDACFPDSVVGFSAFKPIASNKYFLYMLMAYKAILDSMATRSAQKNINLETIASLAYPLPPLAEQERIVARVEELLAACDMLK